MKKTLIILFIPFFIHAQKITRNPVFMKIDSLNFIKFIDSHFTKNFTNEEFYFEDCEESIGFIKFRVDANGKVVDLSSSYEFNKNLAKAVMMGIEQTSYHWKPSLLNGKKVMSKYFLLPVDYILGCFDSKKKFKDNTKRGLGALQRFDEPAIYGYKEYEKSDSEFDCIILHPLYIYGPIR